MTLVPRNIRYAYMRISRKVPLGGGLKRDDDGNYFAIWVATSSQTSEIRPAILFGDMLYPLLAGDWLQSKWPRMTLNGYFMSKSVFGQHFLAQSVWFSEIIAWKVTNIDSSYQRQKCRAMTNFWQYKSFLDIRKNFFKLLSSSWSVVY